MTAVVVGPATISGPGSVDAELISCALECIDEQLGLLDTTVVPAERIWRDAMSAAIGAAPAVTVVCPTWWSATRVNRVRTAAQAGGSYVAMERRTDALRAAAREPDCAVVELGEDLVTISRPGAASSVVRRTGDAITEAVVARVVAYAHVVIDAPVGVSGAEHLAAEIRALLQDHGVTARVLGCDDLRDPELPTPAVPRSARGRLAIGAAAVVAVVGAVGAGLSSRDGPAAAAVATTDPDLTWIVEGRVAMQIPARWTVERTLAGAGSPRLQIVSPDDRGRIIHLTQSAGPRDQPLDVAARSLREAAARLRAGVIVDFEDSGISAGRAAIRYREVRGDRIVEWSVLLDGPVRIAIGCQGASARPICETAIRSAHRTD